jgi:hypothetical protein
MGMPRNRYRKCLCMSKQPPASIARTLDVPLSVVKAWQGAICRARRRGIPYTLSRAELDTLWLRCEGRCAVSGLEFSEETFPDALVKRPYAPSIDQIEATKGYTLSNARITCVVANFAMNQWGLSTLRRLAHGVVTHEQEEVDNERPWYSRQNKKLREAEQLALSLTGEALVAQRHRIAGLKRAITMGPLKLANAAVRANLTMAESGRLYKAMPTHKTADSADDPEPLVNTEPPDVWYGEVGKDIVDTSYTPEELEADDDTDDELDETPADVVAMLGFDPATDAEFLTMLEPGLKGEDSEFKSDPKAGD